MDQTGLLWLSSGFPGAKRRGGGVLGGLHPEEHAYQLGPGSGPGGGAPLHHDPRHGTNAGRTLLPHRPSAALRAQSKAGNDSLLSAPVIPAMCVQLGLFRRPYSRFFIVAQGNVGHLLFVIRFFLGA